MFELVSFLFALQAIALWIGPSSGQQDQSDTDKDKKEESKAKSSKKEGKKDDKNKVS